MKKTVSLDGGGIKELRALEVLIWLEKQTGKPCNKLFDEIVGTSAGGIAALGLGHGLSAQSLKEFFLENGPAIFHASAWRSFATLGGIAASSKYTADALESALTGVFGPALIPPGVRVSTFDTFAWAPRILSFRDAWTCVEAARATSAAPTYFPALVKGDRAYWDGGMTINNPSLLAATGEPTLILSLGDGSAAHGMTAKKVLSLHPIELIGPALSACMDGGVALVDAEALARKDVTYVRIQGGPYSNDSLDDASASNMKTLSNQGLATIGQHESDLVRVMGLL
jgi:predicted acylesterase/phospholipase RssA